MSCETKLIIFDWDGTLSDSLSRIVECLQVSAQEVGLTPPSHSEGREVIGLGLTEALATLFPDLAGDAIAALRQCYSRNYVRLDRLPASFYPGVRNTLDVLKERGFRLAMATGKSRRGFDRVVEAHGLTGYFDASRCADETASKPDPRMLLELLGMFDCPPEAALMIGDTEFDMAMAATAGVSRVGVDYGAHHPDRLRRYDLVACLARFPELLKLI
ncbi:MAG: HAD family hydrolase [Porticoccaceae bacterium]|nr:HAD family hydrolase [Porticoccaceae bacterium]